MAWIRCTEVAEDPQGVAYRHEGHPMPLAGDLRDPEELGASYAGVGPDSTVGGRPQSDVRGWRSACECGWRGDVLARTDFDLHGDDGYPPPYVEGYAEAQWAAHVDAVLARDVEARRS